MKLHYRGVDYEADAKMVEVEKTEVVATYRGSAYRVSRPAGEMCSRRHGVYRGVAY